jgi:hypothetical protein
MGPGPGLLFVCKTCGRRFKYDSSERATWAVGKGQTFAALESSVNRRWLNEMCTGGPARSDEADSKRTRSKGVPAKKAARAVALGDAPSSDGTPELTPEASGEAL